MTKSLRYTLKALAWILGILVLIWISLLAYVNLNEARLIDRISSVIKKTTKGEVKIGTLSVSFIRTFPIISLQLSDIVLRDSVYAIHKQDLFRADDVYLRVSLPGLISGKSPLGRILVRNGAVNILTDSTGYSNEYVFKTEEKQAEEKRSSFPDITFDNVELTYTNPLRNKLHRAIVNRMKCVIEENDGLLNFGLNLNMQVESLTFNTEKGTYLKNKKVEGKFRLIFDKKQKNILIKNIRLDIDDHPFYFNGRFHIDKIDPDFNLSISTYKIKYEKAVSLLNDTLQNKLNGFLFSEPIDVTVDLKGKTFFKYVPAARVMLDLDLKAVNNFGSTTFELQKGSAAINVMFNGPDGRNDTLIDKIEGSIDIKGAEIKYIPRNILLKGLGGTVKFLKDDLVVEKFKGVVGSTKLEMNGIAEKFISVLNSQPEKVNVQWKVYSPDINLEDFTVFLSENNAKTKHQQKTPGPTSKIDKVFTDGDISLSLESPRMHYKKFMATKVLAAVVLGKAEITLKNVSFNHANGTMEVTGKVKNMPKYNPVTVITKMRKMDVPLLFTAFDNFGQDAITNKNLKGTLSADVKYSTLISDKAQLMPKSADGTINFLLENGELNNFEPLQEVSKKYLKSRIFRK